MKKKEFYPQCKDYSEPEPMQIVHANPFLKEIQISKQNFSFKHEKSLY